MWGMGQVLTEPTPTHPTPKSHFSLPQPHPFIDLHIFSLQPLIPTMTPNPISHYQHHSTPHPPLHRSTHLLLTFPDPIPNHPTTPYPFTIQSHHPPTLTQSTATEPTATNPNPNPTSYPQCIIFVDGLPRFNKCCT